LSAFVSAVEKLPTDLSFEVGHRVFFYQVVDFTEAKTQEALRKECCNSAARDLLPRTSSVKDALSLRTEWPQTAKATREKYALATLLYELRDSLCLSDAAYAVFTTKWDGKYQDNIQLVPKSLLGSLNSESARVVLEQLRHHLDRPQNEHVSVLFAASTSEFSIEVRRRGEQPNVKVLHRNDGVPYHLICDIPDSFFPKLSEAEPAVPQNRATPRYHFDQQGGFSSFFFEFDPDTLLRVSQNDQQRSSKDINGDHQNSISKVVSKALGSCFTGAATQVVIKAVMNCVRCGILKLNGGEGAWTTCFYIRNRSQGEPHFPRRTASGD